MKNHLFFTLTRVLKNSYKSWVNDLVSLPFSIKIFMFVMICLILWNNFFDLNHFIDRINHPTIWVIINNERYPAWKQSLLLLSGIASISNIFALFLIAYGKISNFFWGIIGVISYGLYAIAWNYIGDMQLNLFFFLPMQFVGYYFWKKHLDNNRSVIIDRLNWQEGLITIYSIILMGLLFYFEIPEFSRFLLQEYAFDGTQFKNLVPHLLDSLTNTLSVVAIVLLFFRFREQWILWIFVDICHFIMYAGVADGKIDLNMLFLWLIALVNVGIGFYQWYYIRSKEPKEPASVFKISHYT